jgi:GDP/UDP-N,N'-diacetylbacillosamine 2-epimerase (hydrolysing)
MQMLNRNLLEQCDGQIRVLVLTAIRSEYDLLYPLARALDEDPAFEVAFIVAGAHLTRLHNHSIRLIKSDGFRVAAEIANFEMSDDGNTPYGRVRAAARLLEGLSEVLEKEKPDLLVYLGDREEPLMAAIAANYLGIPAIHIAGGDNAHPIGGDVDEEARHATTKLSHIHLTMAKEHETRVLMMGEESWRVRTVGNPGLDRLRCEPLLSLAEMEIVHGSFVRDAYLVLVYHAVSSGLADAPLELDLCIRESIATGIKVFIGAPNNDPGYASLLNVIKKYSNHPQIKLYSNLPRAEFAALLKRARAIVGNSSLGLLEASFIGVPAVNVGQRQRGRLAGVNVQFVDAEKEPLKQALSRALFDEEYRKCVLSADSIYGDGYMVGRAVSFIKALPSKEKLLDKRITY